MGMAIFRERWGTALPACALMGMTACAQVTIQACDGSVTQNTRFGFLSIEPRPGRTAQIIDLQGIGLIGHNGGLTLGYLAASTAVLPTGDCRVVIWIDDTETAPAALADLLGGTSDLCAVGPGAR